MYQKMTHTLEDLKKLAAMELRDVNREELVDINDVETKKDLKAFIEFHYDLYEGNAYDVPNLYSDELNTLSPERNAAFDFYF